MTKQMIYLEIKTHRKVQCHTDCMGMKVYDMGAYNSYECRIFNQSLLDRPMLRVPECLEAEDSGEDEG